MGASVPGEGLQGIINGGLAAGPASLIGGTALQTGMQFAGTKYAHDLESASADKQMAFQRDMSNTAHQRQVNDLMKAGLNPNLATAGKGAETTSGAMASATAPNIQMPDLMAYGISLKQLEQTDQRIALEGQKAAADIARNISETDLNKMKKILAQKGMPRAMLEGEASEVLKKGLEWLKKKSPLNAPDFIKEDYQDKKAKEYLNRKKKEDSEWQEKMKLLKP